MPISSVGSEPLRSARQTGFTLIEVLVVLVILALTMALVVPAIGKGRGANLEDVARDVQISLRKARAEAVLRQRSSAVLVDVRARTYRLEHEPDEMTIAQPIAVTASVASSELHGSMAGIRFFPDGSSTGGFVRLSIGGSSTKVEVDWLTGRVSVRREGS